MTLRGLANRAARFRSLAHPEEHGSHDERTAPVPGWTVSPWAVAHWLVVVLLVDLVVTRFLLRLAIFVPKSELAAAVVGPVARTGAVIENLLALLVLSLLTLLVAASFVPRTRSLPGFAPPPGVLWRCGLVATVLVASAGLVLLALPPTPPLLVVLGLALVAAGLAFLPSVLVGREDPYEAIGLGLLGSSLVATGLGRALAAAMLMPGAGAEGASTVPVGDPAPISHALLFALGAQVLYGLGAVVLGLAGLRAGRIRWGLESERRTGRNGWGGRGWLLAGLLVAGIASWLVVQAPGTIGMLLIWTLGLSGVVPLGAVAIGLGIVVAGLGRLQASHPRRALGPLLVLLAGAAPATSSLVVAALLGLALAGAEGAGERVP